MTDSCTIVFWVIVMLLQIENHIGGTKIKIYTLILDRIKEMKTI